MERQEDRLSPDRSRTEAREAEAEEAVRIFCAWCRPDAPLMRDDGDDARITPGICPLHKQAMLAKLRECPITLTPGGQP